MVALGLIETVGYTTAVSAADAAVKAADVEIIGMEKVIGVSGYVSVTIHFSGDVAAVQSAVDAGSEVANNIGQVVTSEVIPRAHSEVQSELLKKFELKSEEKEKEEPAKKEEKVEKATEKAEEKKTATKKTDTKKKPK